MRLKESKQPRSISKTRTRKQDNLNLLTAPLPPSQFSPPPSHFPDKNTLLHAKPRQVEPGGTWTDKSRWLFVVRESKILSGNNFFPPKSSFFFFSGNFGLELSFFTTVCLFKGRARFIELRTHYPKLILSPSFCQSAIMVAAANVAKQTIVQRCQTNFRPWIYGRFFNFLKMDNPFFLWKCCTFALMALIQVKEFGIWQWRVNVSTRDGIQT